MCDDYVTIRLQLCDKSAYSFMMIVQETLFALPLAIGIIAFGASVWVTCKPRQARKK